MHCPFCFAAETKVIDSRLSEDGMQVKRRRECAACNERFTTYENAELLMPRVIKRDGSRVTFDLEKIRKGMLRALEKRPVSVEQVDEGVNNIVRRIRALGEREIQSEMLGQFVMDELQALDKVAYVRFASVYRSFEDVNEFLEVIKRLLASKT